MKTISISSISWIVFAVSSSFSFSFNAKLTCQRRSLAGFRLITKEVNFHQKLFLQSPVNENLRYESSVFSGPIGNINELETKEGGLNLKVIIPVVLVLAAAAAAVVSGQFGTFDFTKIIEESAAKIENMGPYGYIYFALVSIIL